MKIETESPESPTEFRGAVDFGRPNYDDQMLNNFTSPAEHTAAHDLYL